MPFKKRVRQIIAQSSEKKYEDTFFSSQSISNSATNTQLYTVASGADEDQRVGFRIRMTGIYGHFQIQNGDDVNVVRLSIIGLKGGASLPGWGIYNVIDKEQYKVYFDKHYNLTAPFTGGSQFKDVIVRHNFKNRFNSYMGKFHEFDTISSTSGIEKIYFVMVSDSSVVSHPAILGNLRCWYIDL